MLTVFAVHCLEKEKQLFCNDSSDLCSAMQALFSYHVIPSVGSESRELVLALSHITRPLINPPVCSSLNPEDSFSQPFATSSSGHQRQKDWWADQALRAESNSCGAVGCFRAQCDAAAPVHSSLVSCYVKNAVRASLFSSHSSHLASIHGKLPVSRKSVTSWNESLKEVCICQEDI